MNLPHSHFPQGTLFKHQNVPLQCFQGPFGGKLVSIQSQFLQQLNERNL